MTTLVSEELILPSADLGAENPFPTFRETQPNMEIRVDASVPAEDRLRLGWQISHRVLPYRLQDGYNRTKRPRTFQSVVLENEILRGIFLPELGGRLISLKHKATDRELLDRNPVFQPANLALRNAWFSGGIEWNASHFGHHYLTCSPVFASRVECPSGYPVLRLHEWDRVKCFPWQIDFHLPPGSPFLLAWVRLVNPHDHEIPMYWWTNIAVTETDGVRVLAPADSALRGTASAPLGLVNLPGQNGDDITYPTRLRFAQEFYFRVPDHRRRWVAALDRQGTGLIHTSTRRLRGRKFFAWGMNEGGRHWQEYLSSPGRAYLEIQAGLARTQLESVPMPARATWSWTEAFGLLGADPSKVHSADWNAAIESVEEALRPQLGEEDLEAREKSFDDVGRLPPVRTLLRGSGWGALERRRLAHSRKPDLIPPELVFDDITLGALQAPWIGLLETGRLPLRDPQEDTGAWMVQPEWQALLEQSVRTPIGDHWLAWLHLGNMRMEAQDAAGAVEAWRCSLSCQRSGWALRNHAVAEQRLGNFDIARRLLRDAWDAGPKIAALAVEYATLLARLDRHEELDAFIQELPVEIRTHERIHIAAAGAALRLGRLDEAGKLFDREFVTIREGETATTDLWFEARARRAADAEKIPLDDALRKRVRLQQRPPIHLDFRITQEPPA